MSTLQNFPSTKPSLNLNFARSQGLDPRITFTRATSATRIGSDGLIKNVSVNEPRFDFDPSTGECLGLLIEEQRANLLTYSEQFENSAWTKNNCSITSNVTATISPDGSSTADKIVENTASSTTHFVLQSSASSSGLVYTFSVFLKAAERTNVQVGLLNQNSPFDNIIAYVNLSTGQVSSSTFGSIANLLVSVIPYPGSWYRVVLTGTIGSSTSLQGIVWTANSSDVSSAARTYTGDGVSGVYVWGAQLEQGAFSTSYIPTIAATVSRAADSASVTGINFSGFYNPDEGSVRARFKFYANHGPYCEAVSIAGSGAGFMVNDIGGGLTTDCYGGNPVSTGGNNATNTFVTGVRAYKFSSNQSVIGCSGTSSITTQTGTITSANTNALWLGRRGSGSTSFGAMNGHIQNVSYYPVRLSNTQLQTLIK